MSGKNEGSIRKLQFTGKSSYSLNVPKEWVEALGLKAQDPLLVMEEGYSLKVIPLKARGSGGHEIDLVTDGSRLDRDVRKAISAYLAGCEVIRVLPIGGRLGLDFKNKFKENITSRLIGFEVTEDSLKELTFQALVASPQLDIFAVVRRMYMISSNMLQESVSSFLRGDSEEAGSVLKADDDVDRFHFYAVRTLNQAVDNPTLLKEISLNYRSEALMTKTILKSVERVADHSVSIAVLGGVAGRVSIDDESLITERLVKAQKAYEAAVSSFLKLDESAAEDVLDECAELKREDSRQEPTEGRWTGLVLEHLRRVSDYSADISEAVVDMMVARRMRKEATVRTSKE
jgi:phosphate uptake regulator